ncbi:glycosyltransferase family 2 protein [Lacinutrix sp. MedPE-SW]|uniref:glycosyltransferase n=1 Tax=Lacinutrix sp. MedPE-SW TaxID=1860087 RepID=UPI00091C84CD|nr:glycosyltransferase family 2 protein [Lacinutrix sp. MedPE-SW]OIQ21928.1 MAG: glycosyl transferase family 2 [Lacinutrix sp. MedPE-SW]
MKIYIIIPAHNEEDCIKLMLNSLVNQTYLPEKIVVVNDNSTDNTQQIINGFSAQYKWIESIKIKSSSQHIPGSKVINAFYKGLETLDDTYDVICKFDADIILPENYLESIISLFKSNSKVGVAGGLAYIEKNNQWVYETIASKNHVRGPFKAYRKACFKEIGGLKHSIGWDTMDVLLAQYYGWMIKTDKSLHVKHLKPTGKTYHKSSKYLQGEALYKMRFGITLTILSALKSAISKRSFSYFKNTVIGYLKAKQKNIQPLVSKEQGIFIRKLRWQGVKSKLGF